VIRVCASVHLHEIVRNCSVKVGILGMRKRSLRENVIAPEYGQPSSEGRRGTIQAATLADLYLLCLSHFIMSVFNAFNCMFFCVFLIAYPVLTSAIRVKLGPREQSFPFFISIST